MSEKHEGVKTREDAPLCVVHDARVLVFAHEFVRVAADEEVYAREGQLGLSQLEGVTEYDSQTSGR
jgi:hypothetical protein